MSSIQSLSFISNNSYGGGGNNQSTTYSSNTSNYSVYGGGANRGYTPSFLLPDASPITVSQIGPNGKVCGHVQYYI